MLRNSEKELLIFNFSIFLKSLSIRLRIKKASKKLRKSISEALKKDLVLGLY